MDFRLINSHLSYCSLVNSSEDTLIGIPRVILCFQNKKADN